MTPVNMYDLAFKLERVYGKESKQNKQLHQMNKHGHDDIGNLKRGGRITSQPSPPPSLHDSRFPSRPVMTLPATSSASVQWRPA